MASFVGISYKAMVWRRPILERCPEDVQKVLLKVARWDHLRDPHGKREGKKGTKTRNVNTGKKSLALERGYTRQTGQQGTFWGTGYWMNETRSLNGCIIGKRLGVGGKGQTPKRGPR